MIIAWERLRFLKTPESKDVVSNLFRRWVGIILSALCMSPLWARPLPVEPAVFRAGAEIVEITPTNYPVRVNAMFTERSATNAVDPLTVRALALDDGTNRLVMAIVDTCMIPRDLIDRAKERASRESGLPTSHMLVSATHTHSAPSAMGCLGSRLDPAYAAYLEPRIAAAISGAIQRLQAARIGWGVVEDWEHTFNRRWIRRPDRLLTDPFGATNVRAHMHPGHESPDALGPSGPVDPGLSVVGVETLDGRPLAVLANYSQHYYGSPLVSSDYFGRFARHLALRLGATNSAGNGPAFVGIMSQGTSGDLMWMDYGAPAKDIGYDAYAQAMADEVAGVWRTMKFHTWAPLKMAERTLSLAYRVPDPERLTWARRMAAGLGDRLPQTLPEIYALEALYLHERPRTELKLQAIRIGELGIAALPNEVFALTGLKLKAQSPLSPTMNIELANGAEGYIPPPEQHRLGGYTTWPARTAGLEAGAEPRIVETLLELLEEVSGRARRPMTDQHGPYAQAVLAARPVAFWRLNESEIPTARDASGHRLEARYEDGVALFLPGAGATVGFHPARPELPNAFSGDQFNRAPHFAGGRLRASLPLSSDRYSVAFWMWNGLPAAVRGITGCVVSRGREGDSEAAGDHLMIAGQTDSEAAGKLMFVTVANGGPRVSGRTHLKLRTWHQVVLVRDGRSVAVYLDGQPTPELSGEADVALGSDEKSVFVGGRSDGTVSFEGKVDEVAWFDRALTPAEVSALHAASGLGR